MMRETLAHFGYSLKEKRGCCGRVAERWVKDDYSVTVYPQQEKFVLRRQGRYIVTSTQPYLYGFLEQISKGVVF